MVAVARSLSVVLAASFASRGTEAWQVTTCETESWPKCKEPFAVLDKSGKRAECLESRDLARWTDMKTCCPTMNPLGFCILRNCTNAKTFASTVGYSKAETHHAALAALLCKCQESCSKSVSVIEKLMKDGEVAALTLLADMSTKKLEHPTVQILCEADGWDCAQKNAVCKEMLDLPDVRIGAAAIQGIMRYCPKDTPSPTPSTGSTTTQTAGATSKTSSLFLLRSVLAFMLWKVALMTSE